MHALFWYLVELSKILKWNKFHHESKNTILRLEHSVHKMCWIFHDGPLHWAFLFIEFYSNDYPSIIKRKITTWTKLLQITQRLTRWSYEFVHFELDKSKNYYYIQCIWWILNLFKQIPSSLCIYNSSKFIRVVISRQILDYALSRIIYTYTLKIILVCWSCTKLMWFWERLKQILE